MKAKSEITFGFGHVDLVGMNETKKIRFTSDLIETKNERLASCFRIGHLD